MQTDWILDVLMDLKSFATQNQMLRLAEQLDDTMIVAASDVRRANAKANAGEAGTPGEARRSA